jgi:tetratricopeptide (TPR) repeat protein
MRVQLGCALIGLVLVGCTQSPVARPPVVDASWRATAQDRVQPSTPRQSEVAPPPVRGIDPAREQGETNRVIPIAPVAKIAPIDAPKAERTIPPAVISLLDQADQLRVAGDLNAASGRLERALRIAPEEAEVYYQLARIRLEQGGVQESVSIATQGVELAGADNALKRDLWTLIATARDRLGDTGGATQARVRARALN